LPQPDAEAFPPTDDAVWTCHHYRTAATTIAKETTMKTSLDCPCGEHITGRDEDDLVEKVQEHLKAKHPDHQYTREQILMIAY
jgi:hypothetical protein